MCSSHEIGSGINQLCDIFILVLQGSYFYERGARRGVEEETPPPLLLSGGASSEEDLTPLLGEFCHLC